MSQAVSLRLVLSGMALAVVASFAQPVSAQAASAPRSASPAVAKGMGGHPMMMLGSGKRLDHLLTNVGASDAQRAQIKQIADAVAVDLKPLHDAGRALHQQSVQVLTAASVDANAAETVRAQMSANHDQVSRRMTRAMLDVANVLTPEQRTKLATHLQMRSEHRGGRH